MLQHFWKKKLWCLLRFFVFAWQPGSSYWWYWHLGCESHQNVFFSVLFESYITIPQLNNSFERQLNVCFDVKIFEQIRNSSLLIFQTAFDASYIRDVMAELTKTNSPWCSKTKHDLFANLVSRPFQNTTCRSEHCFFILADIVIVFLVQRRGHSMSPLHPFLWRGQTLEDSDKRVGSHFYDSK